MEKIVQILKRNWIYPLGAIIGGLAGYLYWFYVGCNSGTCPITSSSTASIIWGTMMGILLFSMFKKESDK